MKLWQAPMARLKWQDLCSDGEFIGNPGLQGVNEIAAHLWPTSDRSDSPCDSDYHFGIIPFPTGGEFLPAEPAGHPIRLANRRTGCRSLADSNAGALVRVFSRPLKPHAANQCTAEINGSPMPREGPASRQVSGRGVASRGSRERPLGLRLAQKQAVGEGGGFPSPGDSR